MKKILCFLCLALFALAPLSQAKDASVVFIPKSSDQDFWTFMRQGVDKAVSEAGNVQLTWRGPSYNDDTEAQIKILQSYTREGVDAIIIAPTDRIRLQEPIHKAASMGIKVIVVDSALDGNDYQNFITTDNFSAGKLAARRLVEVLQGTGKVMVLRTVAGSASTDDRANGFLRYVRDNAPKIKVIADEYGGGSRGKVLHSAEQILKQHPDIAGIFAVNESASDGVLRALRAQNKAGKIKLVGFDSTDFLINGITQGEIQGLVIQNPRQMGYLGIKAALAAVNNAPLKDTTVFTEAVLITQDNYRNPDMQKLLVP